MIPKGTHHSTLSTLFPHYFFAAVSPFFAPHQRRVEENIIIIIINFTEISNRMMSTEQMVKLHLHWRVPNGKRAAEEVASIVRATTAAWCKYVSLWRTQNKRFLLFFVQFLCFLQFLPPCVCVSFFTWIFFQGTCITHRSGNVAAYFTLQINIWHRLQKIYVEMSQLSGN